MTIEHFDINEYVSYVREISKKCKILIFGAGNYGNIIGEHLSINNIDWCGYIDNNSSKHGKSLNNKPIYGLENWINNYDTSELFILVSVSPIPFKCEQGSIEQQLINFGIKESNYYFISHSIELVDSIVYLLKDADKYIQQNIKIKNVYSGKRAFIIGNGPSLTVDDLSKLKNDITYGCNRITQMYSYTDWRITDYFFADPLFISNSIEKKEDIDKITTEHSHVFTTLQSRIFDEFKDSYGNLFFLRNNRTKNMCISEDLTQYIGNGGTSLFEIFQIAVYMGIKEFYLLGVDYSFNKEMKDDGKLIVNENVQSHAKEIDQGNGVYYVDDIMKAWLSIKAYSAEHNIKIYNATRGGKLEVFPRVDFDLLFE